MSRRVLLRLGAAVAALSVFATGAAACQVVAGLNGDFTQAPVHDAGAGGTGTGGSVPTGCMSATYPDPPSGADDGISNDVVFALRTVDLGESDPVPPGYDLDHVCTCFDDAGPSCVSKQPHCDANGGIDSASAQFFSLIKFAVGSSHFSSDAYSAKIEKGVWTLLVRLQGYNGKADDPQVDVALYPSTGTSTPPLWDGTDAWSILDQSVTSGDPNMPVYTSAGAYVANHTLVAAMPTVLMQLGATDDTITMNLTGGVITGTLVQGPAGWTITGGILAARWKASDLFQALSSYRDGTGKPLCTDIGLVYQTAKTNLCTGLDILADSSGAKSLPCDALSIGIGFTAATATIGAIDPPPMVTPGCPPATDPANDSCPM